MPIPTTGLATLQALRRTITRLQESDGESWRPLDLFQPDFQKYYHKGWVDPSVPNTALTPNIDGRSSLPPFGPTGVNTYKHNFSPRIGLAYALNNKTVVRAGYELCTARQCHQLSGANFVQGFNGNYDLTSGNIHWSTDSPSRIIQLRSGTFLVVALPDTRRVR